MSRIEWTDITWNPVTGCTKVSPGCDHCYAEAMTKRFQSKWGDFGTVRFHEDRLSEPRRWRKPQRIFVCSMADLWHKDVTHTQLLSVFEAMSTASAQRHTYQVLTKRSSRMADWLRAWVGEHKYFGPMPHLWAGVSVEDRKRLIRVNHLQRAPAAVRFLSCEPLLEDLGPLDLRGIDWVIVGGESGPGARPMLASWADRILHQCREAGVPFFLKQMGSVWTHGRGNGGKPEDIPEHLFVREFPR